MPHFRQEQQGVHSMAKGRQRAALAVIIAGILSAVVIRAARSDDDIASAAGASHCDAHHTATPALHTATPGHHHLRHASLAAHHHRRAHVTPEIRAQKPTLRTVASTPPAPAKPARESHPRAALPVIVRPVHHPTWEGGSRLAALLPRASATLPVSSTMVGGMEDVRFSQTRREVSEARGPPRLGPIAPLPPAFAQRPISSHARVPRSTVLSKVSEPVPVPSAPAHGIEADRFASAPCPGATAASRRAPESTFAWVDPALPHGRADVRRLESATACFSVLSAGGIP